MDYGCTGLSESGPVIYVFLQNPTQCRGNGSIRSSKPYIALVKGYLMRYCYTVVYKIKIETFTYVQVLPPGMILVVQAYTGLHGIMQGNIHLPYVKSPGQY